MVVVRGITGSTRVKVGAGSIDLDDMAGSLDQRFGASGVEATRLRSRLMSATSGAGSVNLEFAAPPDGIEAEVGAGSVDIEVPRDTTTDRIVTGQGEARLTVGVPTDAQSSRVLDAQAGAGSIHHPAR